MLPARVPLPCCICSSLECSPWVFSLRNPSFHLSALYIHSAICRPLISALAPELLCPVPAGTPARLAEVMRAEELYKSHLLSTVPGVADLLLINPPDYICFTSKCQSRAVSVEKQQAKPAQRAISCLVTLCQVRLPSDLLEFHSCCPLGCQAAQSFNPRSFMTDWNLFVWSYFNFFFPLSVSSDNHANQQNYCLIIDKMDLNGAKCKGK